MPGHSPTPAACCTCPAPAPAVARVLDLTGVQDAAQVCASVDEVMEACAPQPAVTADEDPLPSGLGGLDGGTSGSLAAGAGTLSVPLDRSGARELQVLRAEVRHLRARARAHPLIDQAQGVLRERHGISDPRVPFELLRDASQRYNVRLRTVAAAVVTAAGWPPEPAARDTVGGRLPAPDLPFLPDGDPDRAHCGEVINAVLRRTLHIADTDMGDVQLVDAVIGGMRLEAHAGLSEEFVDFFDHVADGTAFASAAALGLGRVTVTDVATDSVFSEPARAVVLAAGSRSVHSTPLTDADVCIGMASAHLPTRSRALSSAQARALDEMGVQAGRWLGWHRRTVVSEALEYLDRKAVVGVPEPR